LVCCLNVESINEEMDMRRSKFSEEQIITILAEQERGMKAEEVCSTHRINPATFYKWKVRFGGMDVWDACKPKSLETENARLRQLLADQMLDNVILKWRNEQGINWPLIAPGKPTQNAFVESFNG